MYYLQDWLGQMSKEWKEMTMDAKHKYVAEATKLQEVYKINMEKWKQDMIQAGYHDLLKPNVKSKFDSSGTKYEKQDLQCPDHTKTQNTESVVATCSDIGTQIEKGHKLGWGTDVTCHTPKKPSNFDNGN